MTPAQLTTALAVCLAALSTLPVQAQAPALPVAVAPVVSEEITVGKTFVGTVEPVRRSVVGSAVDGRVVEIPVDEGDYVQVAPAHQFQSSADQFGGTAPADGEAAANGEEVGQPLVQLRTGTIDIQIRGARAELELRKHELAEMQAGTRLKELEQRQAELERAKALKDYAQKRHDRLSSLSRAATKEEVEQAYSSWIAAEQNLKAAEAAMALAQEGPRQEQKDQAQARLDAQNEAVALIEDRRKKYTIRAPFDGYVIKKHTEVGAWIQTGDPVAEVIQIDPVQIAVPVPEAYIAQVGSRSSVTVEIDSLSAGQRTFPGKVYRIVPQADVRSRTFPVIIRLANPRDAEGIHRIKAAMLAHATIGNRQTALLVPKDALVLGQGKPFVYATDGPASAGQEAKVQQVPVTPGVSHGRLVAVEGRLKPGQMVIVEGNERFRGNMIRVTTVRKTEP